MVVNEENTTSFHPFFVFGFIYFFFFQKTLGLVALLLYGLACITLHIIIQHVCSLGIVGGGAMVEFLLFFFLSSFLLCIKKRVCRG